MKLLTLRPARQNRAPGIAIGIWLTGLACVQAQPSIISTVPAFGATNVSPSASVVFRFSEPMDTGLTTADFLDASTFTTLPTSSEWSEFDTVLTCSPTPPFPFNRMIVWSVGGESLIGDPLEGEMEGYFNTSSGNTSAGTNGASVFAVGKVHIYNQSSTAAPTVDPETPYNFIALTALASNRVASDVTVALPTGSLSNLTENPDMPEVYSLFSTWTDLGGFNSTFPAGNYVFNVIAATSNQQVTVNLPASLVQPNAPHVSNYAAAQSVDATLPFELSWDAFQGGTAADSISVSIEYVFRTPAAGAPGALSGTATSLVIPAGTLQPSSNYTASISFHRATSSSNASYTTTAYLATTTDFTLRTSGDGTMTEQLVFTNATWSGGLFSFEVTSAPGQTFTVEYSATMLAGEWQTLMTTNSATGRARFTHSTATPYQFYRARNGL